MPHIFTEHIVISVINVPTTAQVAIENCFDYILTYVDKKQQKNTQQKSLLRILTLFLKHNNLMKAATISINANAFSAIYDFASGT